jgi:aryl-alcohol dehydrogenase-like predicted oxidoreductase
MLQRKEQEVEYQVLFEKYHYGMISWGSLSGGFLTDKHLNNSSSENQKTRFNDPSFWFTTDVMKKIHQYEKNNTEESLKKLKELQGLANSVGFNLNHLALAWVLKFRHLDSALVGARTVTQLEDSLKALEMLAQFTPEFEVKANKILENNPEPRMNFVKWAPNPPVRPSID